MTNEELKKKIVKVIDNWANNAVKTKRSGASVYDPYNAAELADALIAAGIGDVSNIIRLAADNALLDIVIHKAEVRNMEKRVKDAEHRAEVAERALKIAVNNAYDYTCEEAIAQAKKELEENGKNEQD